MKNLLTKWETLFLLFLTIPIMGHVVILPIMLDVAGRDVWLSILLSLPFAILFAFAIYRLRIHFPNTEIKDILVQLLGKWFSKAVILLLIFYFSFLMVFSFAALVDFTFIEFLPSTPRVAILTWFWIFCIYAAVKGIKGIALTAGVLAFFSIIIGHIVTLLTSPEKEWIQLRPMIEYGWSPVLLGTLIIVSIWMELLLLLCVPIKNIHEKRFFLIWVIGVLLNAIMMLSTTTGVIAIFGLDQAENFLYPASEGIRLITLGFLDRFDVYALFAMTFGTYIRCSLYLRLTYELSISKTTSKWGKRAIFAVFAIAAFFGAMFTVKDHLEVERLVIIYTYMIFLFPLPFFLLGISWLKRRKTANLLDNEQYSN